MKRTLFLCALALWVGLGVAAARPYTTNLHGVLIRYSLPGAVAYFDTNDLTVTFEILQPGGDLTVSMNRTVQTDTFWGDADRSSTYIDMYIYAGTNALRNVRITGLPNARAYVTGECDSIRTFTLMNGAVGNTDTYGDRGIFTFDRSKWITSITMRNAILYGALGGPYPAMEPVAPSLGDGTAASAPRTAKSSQ